MPAIATPMGRVLLQGALIPQPPSGFGYVYKTDSAGNNQVITITRNGLTYPLVARIRA